MNKKTVRILTMALSFIMLFTITPALRAEAATKKLKNKTIYMQTYSYILRVDGIKSVKGVKSSNRKVLVPESFCARRDSYTDTWINDYGVETSDETAEENYACMYFSPKKSGTSNISFTADGKKYSQKVTVKKYVNPLKMLTISNVNEGSDIRGSLGKTNSVAMDTTAADTVRLTAMAAGGWQITEISFTNKITNDSDICEAGAYGKYTLPRTRASVTVGDYNSSSYGYADITLRNKKNKGEIIISVTLNPSK